MLWRLDCPTPPRAHRKFPDHIGLAPGPWLCIWHRATTLLYFFIQIDPERPAVVWYRKILDAVPGPLFRHNDCAASVPVIEQVFIHTLFHQRVMEWSLPFRLFELYSHNVAFLARRFVCRDQECIVLFPAGSPFLFLCHIKTPNKEKQTQLRPPTGSTATVL